MVQPSSPLAGESGAPGLTTTVTSAGALTSFPSLARKANVSITGAVVAGGASNAIFVVSAPAMVTGGPDTCVHTNSSGKSFGCVPLPMRVTIVFGVVV